MNHRIFPWGCAAGFLRRIVPDAAPQHGLMNGMPHIQKQQQTMEPSNKFNTDDTTTITNGNNNIIGSNNNNKGASLLIKRLPSIGERVL